MSFFNSGPYFYPIHNCSNTCIFLFGPMWISWERAQFYFFMPIHRSLSYTYTIDSTNCCYFIYIANASGVAIRMRKRRLVRFIVNVLEFLHVVFVLCEFQIVEAKMWTLSLAGGVFRKMFFSPSLSLSLSSNEYRATPSWHFSRRKSFGYGIMKKKVDIF